MKHKIKQVLSLLLTLAMLCSLLVTTSFAAGGSWSGNGTKASPYLIEDADDLRALAEKVNSGTKYSGTYFMLTADITVPDWDPIGYNTNYYFAGDFDGNGYTVTIQNIKITSTRSNAEGIGLFGCLEGVVHDVTVDGTIEYTGGTYIYAGGIAGRVLGAIYTRAAIVNCVNHASISVKGGVQYTYGGGIVGYIDNGFVELDNCYNTGTISSNYRGGSIVGYANGGTIRYCYMPSASLYTLQTSNYATLESCIDNAEWDIYDEAYRTSWINAANAAVSAYTTVTDFWSVGSDGYPAHVTDRHLPPPEETEPEPAEPVKPAEPDERLQAMTIDGVDVALSTNHVGEWELVTPGNYLRSRRESNDATWSQTLITMTSDTKFTVSFDYGIENGYTLDYFNITLDGEFLVNVRGDAAPGHYTSGELEPGTHELVVTYQLFNLQAPLNGRGTLSNITIKAICGHSNKEQIDYVDATCTEGGYTVYRCLDCEEVIAIDDENSPALGHDWQEGVCTRCGAEETSVTPITPAVTTDTSWYSEEEAYFTLTTEAQLRGFAQLVNEGNSFAGKTVILGNDIQLTEYWTPIGTGSFTDNPFSGVFDGDGHTIRGLVITVPEAKVGSAYGLFGQVRGATIKNLAVSGDIANHQFDNDSGKQSYFGGIVGMAYMGLTLENCASHVNVSNMYYWQGSGTAPESYVGGLVGYSLSGVNGGGLTIRNCYSDGDIQNYNTSNYYYNNTKNYVGGLVGGFYDGYGLDNSITNSFTLAGVTCSSTNWQGAVIGYTGGTIDVTDSYYVTGYVSDTTGATGIRSTELGSLSDTLNVNAGSELFVKGGIGLVFVWEKTEGTSTTPATPTVTADISWYSKWGNSFTITTEAQLKGFAQLVNEGNDFAGKTVILGNDITLTNAWTPIGVYVAGAQMPFSGTFQGGGHTISGLSIENKSTRDYNGLFAYISNATIEKVIVTGSVTGGNYTAGLVGYAWKSVIRYCGSEVTVSGCGEVGGIVAHAYNTQILECYNKGTVSNTKTTDAYTGGIVGDMTYNGGIVSCYNMGVIDGGPAQTYGYAGGIAGMSADSPIMRSYSTGNVTGNAHKGGIVGEGNPYYQQGSLSYYLEGSAQRGIGDAAVDDSPEYITSVSEDDLKDATSEAVQNLGSAYAAPDGSVNGGYPTLLWESDSDHVLTYITELWNKADLLEFASNIRTGYTYEGETVKLMADIDLEGSIELIPGEYNTTTSKTTNAWTALGDIIATRVENGFYGTFDGQGHTIENMVISNFSSGHLGLFAVLPEGATVKNLTVTGEIFSAASSIGSIVGWNLGTVENCVSYVNINVSTCSSVGGIVANNLGTVKNCINHGTVNGNLLSIYVGGVVGHCEPGYERLTTSPVIINCVNTGDVTGNQYVGGIVGGVFNEDSTNYYIPDITNCYNAGTVTGYYLDEDGYPADIGIIAGKTITGLVNCYYQLDEYTGELPLPGDVSGEDYTRPVSADYAKTDAFTEQLGGFVTYNETEGFVLTKEQV